MITLMCAVKLLASILVLHGSAFLYCVTVYLLCGFNVLISDFYALYINFIFVTFVLCIF